MGLSLIYHGTGKSKFIKKNKSCVESAFEINI